MSSMPRFSTSVLVLLRVLRSNNTLFFLISVLQGSRENLSSTKEEKGPASSLTELTGLLGSSLIVPGGKAYADRLKVGFQDQPTVKDVETIFTGLESSEPTPVARDDIRDP